MEETIFMVLGLVMFYSWIHSIIIIVKNLKGTTLYQKVVLYVGLAGAILYFLGT